MSSQITSAGIVRSATGRRCGALRPRDSSCSGTADSPATRAAAAALCPRAMPNLRPRPSVGTVKDVVVERSALRAERIAIAVFLVEFEARTPRVVEECCGRNALAVSDEEGNRLVDWIGGLLPAKGVGVPVDKGFVAPVKRTGLVAQAEIVLVRGRLAVDAEGRAVILHGPAGQILRNDVARQVGHRQLQRVFPDRHLQFGRLESDRSRVGLRGHRTDALREAGRTAHEASSGNCPAGPTRTRSTSSRRAVICMIAAPACISIPLGVAREAVTRSRRTKPDFCWASVRCSLVTLRLETEDQVEQIDGKLPVALSTSWEPILRSSEE